MDTSAEFLASTYTCGYRLGCPGAFHGTNTERDGGKGSRLEEDVEVGWMDGWTSRQQQAPACLSTPVEGVFEEEEEHVAR